MLTGLLVAAAVMIVLSAHRTWKKIPESYAAWSAGNLVVGYLNAHTNRWPTSWDDLKDVENAQTFLPLDQLQKLVRIDWKADVERLMQNARGDTNWIPHVFTRPDGERLRSAWGADTEPNGKVARYLRQR